MRHIIACLFGACCWYLIVFPVRTYAIDSRFELDPDVLAKKVGISAPPPVHTEPHVPHATTPRVPVHRKRAGHTELYTVRPGDNIYKILIRQYGMTDAEAEALLPEVKRLNGVTDIHALQVGTRLKIPGSRSGGSGLPAPVRQVLDRKGRTDGTVPPSPIMHLNATSGGGAPAADAGIEPVRRVWDRLVRTGPAEQAPLDISGRNFSLSIDPAKFPMFPAADGGKILIDADRSLPPLVRSLLQDSDHRIRVVSESPSNRHRFFSAVLSAAKFYSVEENFAVSFGSDPQLTVTADYKIEKSPDSVLKQDVVLLNTEENQRGMPASLTRFLGKEGFSVVETSLPVGGPSAGDHEQLCLITERDPRRIADHLLKALSVPYESDRSIAVFDQKDTGFSLSVKADRYFEEGGQKFVVSSFANDPVNYTLMRLLETRGYRIIMLESTDTFKKVAEKLLSRLRIPGTYTKQPLWSSSEIPYSVRMSGIMLRDRHHPDTRLFLTDRDMSPLVRDLVDFNGITVQAN